MDDERSGLTPRTVAVTHLPEGWKWRLYDDGSGGLYSPENKCVVEVDFATSEYRRDGKWYFLSGYPHETISSGEFMERMEKSISSGLERENKVKPSILKTLESNKQRVAAAVSGVQRKMCDPSL